MLRTIQRLSLVFILLLAFTTNAFADHSEIAHVIKVIPGAFVARDGKTVPLALKDAVRANDTITTDASGKVQLIFSDDSTVSLGNDTNFSMRDYADDPADARFQGHLSNGFVRVITGFIVEQNPEAFRLSTPLGTAGIRGTIVSFRHLNQHSTMFVENTAKTVVFNGVSVAEGFRMDITPSGHNVTAISAKDREGLGQETLISGVAASSNAAASGGRVLVEKRGHVSIYRETDTNAYALQSDGNPQTTAVIDWEAILKETGGMHGGNPVPPLSSLDIYTNGLLADMRKAGDVSNALVTGTLDSQTFNANGFTGRFSFKADLGNGAISSGAMEGRWNNGTESYTLSGGTGSVTAGNATINWNQYEYNDGSIKGFGNNSQMILNGNAANALGAGESFAGTYTVDTATPFDQGRAQGKVSLP